MIETRVVNNCLAGGATTGHDGGIVLRIHFSTADLGRVRLATVPDHVWEVVGSVHLLGAASEAAPFLEWFGCVRERLQVPSVRQAAQLINSRIPPGHLFSAPPVLADLTPAVRTYFDAVIRPHSAAMADTISRDRLHRTRALCAGGLERLLSSFGQAMVWHSPVLEVSCPEDAEIHLRGRGLRLVPSHFCWPTPISLAEPDAMPVVVYPVGHSPPDPRASALDGLLGATRAAVLGVVGGGHCTSEVARLVGVSPATASHHTTVLRDAGLVATHREANAMVHVLTPLGEQLLHREPV